MTKLLLASLALAGTFLLGPVRAEPSTPNALAVEAADRFLDTLTPEQRTKVVFAFDDKSQRAGWSIIPTGFVPRAGISFKQISAEQRDAAMHLLSMVLSPRGLEKVEQMRQADDDFKADGSRRGPPGGDLYFISFAGEPSTDHPWMFRFGDQHLALDITMARDKDVLTSTLAGAYPARFTRDGATIRPLGRESDKALALLQSLDATQRGQATLGYRVADLVLGPGQDDVRIVPEGVKASALNAAQRASLLDLVGEWVGIMNDDAAAVKMKQVEADLDDTWFAWSGPADGKSGDNITAYYRIRGPHLVIEYAPQSDDPDHHVHTIYRDPTEDHAQVSSKP